MRCASLISMGEEIETTKVSQGEAEKFLRQVREETDLLKSWLETKAFADEPKYGYELEGWLVDRDGLPAPQNKELLNHIKSDQFVPEIAKFNFEINGDVHSLNPSLLRQIQNDISEKSERARLAAEKLGLRSVWIGILPTLRTDSLTLENMTPSNRYYALTKRVFELRNGKPNKIQIEGLGSVSHATEDLMIESAATSFQIHTQVPIEKSVMAYNWAQILAGPMVALTANSPFLFGQKLWDETRIPVFEQALAFHGRLTENRKDPVTFGQAYAKESLIEIFHENFTEYPVVLPLLFQSHAESFRHLKFLNGQIWRWNRPILGLNEPQPSLRIEHRPIAAGPTTLDMVANIAFYIGLLNAVLTSEMPPALFLDFTKAKENFYACAQRGMKAEVTWGEKKKTNVQKLLLDTLLPLSRSGLIKMGIDKEDIRYFLDEIVRSRLMRGWTGAAWQKSFIDTHGPDFQSMLEAYIEWQNSAAPVSQWTV